MRFTDTLVRWLQKIGSGAERDALYQVLGPVCDALCSASLNSAGLVIKTGGSALAKTGSTAWVGIANGKFVSVAASTDMPALTGINISAGKFNVVAFYIDENSTVTAVAGTEATALKDVVPPAVPKAKCLIGGLVITYASAFTGGTTPLDTATTIYVSAIGASNWGTKVD